MASQLVFLFQPLSHSVYFKHDRHCAPAGMGVQSLSGPAQNSVIVFHLRVKAKTPGLTRSCTLWPVLRCLLLISPSLCSWLTALHLSQTCQAHNSLPYLLYINVISLRPFLAIYSKPKCHLPSYQ